MHDRCEASGLRVKPNADGRGHCPLCGDDWHALTTSNALAPHTRTHAASNDQVVAVLVALEDQRDRPDRIWSGWPVSAAG